MLPMTNLLYDPLLQGYILMRHGYNIHQETLYSLIVFIFGNDNFLHRKLTIHTQCITFSKLSNISVLVWSWSHLIQYSLLSLFICYILIKHYLHCLIYQLNINFWKYFFYYIIFFIVYRDTYCPDYCLTSIYLLVLLVQHTQHCLSTS